MHCGTAGEACCHCDIARPEILTQAALLAAGVSTPQTMVRAALRYIQEEHPWWQQNNGSDHLWIWTQDHG